MANVQLPFTATQITKILDGRLHSPIQDVVGDNWTVGVPLEMTAGVEYDFEVNGNTRNFSILPDHITMIWNTSTNIATFSEFLNTPEIVANVQFTFNPDTAADGQITVRVYVNETSPILIKEVVYPYKAVTESYTALLTFYAGDSTGFDVKNKGVYFTVEATGNGDMYDPAIEIYRT
jgi:hypothetical protein